jgi:hypothetical protein
VRKQILIVAGLVLAGGVLALGPAAAPAAAQTIAVQAKVPFNFIVLGKTLPSGEYTLTSAPHELKIRDANQRLIAVVIANEVSGRLAGTTGQIIFHCYDDRCFLSELRSPTAGNGRQLLTSKMEALLAKEQHGKYFAVLGEEPVR